MTEARAPLSGILIEQVVCRTSALVGLRCSSEDSELQPELRTLSWDSTSETSIAYASPGDSVKTQILNQVWVKPEIQRSCQAPGQWLCCWPVDRTLLQLEQ